MRINRSIILSTVVALAVAAPAAAQRDEGESPQDVKDQSKTEVPVSCNDEGEDNVIVFDGDLQMWPPNHKYQDLSVTAEDRDGDGDEITLTTTVTHDEYVEDFLPENEESEPGEEEVGAGNTQNDASPFFAADSGSSSVTTTHDVRSERSGRGDGRTYTINADATFDGDSCEATFEVEVPHDMRSYKAPAKDDKTDSTGPNQG